MSSRGRRGPVGPAGANGSAGATGATGATGPSAKLPTNHRKANTDTTATTPYAERRVFTADQACTLTDAYFQPEASWAASDSDYATFIITRYNSAGVSQGVVASQTTRTTGSGGGGAGTNLGKWSLGTLANASMAQGDYITFQIGKTGASGLSVGPGTLQWAFTVP